MRPGILERLRVAEVVGAREILPRPIELPGGEKLLRPEDAERFTELGPDQVLAPLAAIQREVGRLRAHAAYEHGEQVGVLVVRMRADHEHALHVPEHARLLRERSGSPRGRGLELSEERPVRGEEERENEEGSAQETRRTRAGT